MRNAECGMRNGRRGSHGLTRIKALSRRQASVSAVVTFCGIRIANCGSGNRAVIANFFIFFRQIAYRGLGTAYGLW
jgi:hypothetical protein